MGDLYDRMREEGLVDPLLVRAMVQSSIGDGRPFPTIKAAADAYGVHPEQLRMYVRGIRKEPEPKILAALGLERVVFYRPITQGGE